MQHGLPPETHKSRSLVLGHELPTSLKPSPGVMLAQSSSGTSCPLPWGTHREPEPCFQPPASSTVTCQGQTVGDISQMPLEKQEFLVTAINMKLLGPSPAHAGSGTGFLELFVISAWGLAGEGSAWLGANQPHRWE